ncbi:MAG: alpha/beta fold hydrolase [Phototrophicaceae bacterium]
MMLSNELKDRERDILKLMAQGLTNSQIGNSLYLARETVRWYNKQIYSKLGVHNRTHAVTRAQELGLLENFGTIDNQPLPKIQYVKSGDAYIAYQVIGNGPVDVLYMSGFISHLECEWEQPRCAWAYRRIASNSRLIIMDKRGVGLSDRVNDSPDLEQTVQDMRAVLEAVGSQEAVVASSCEGAPAACLMAVRYPDSVQGLMLLNGIVKGSRSVEFPWAMPVSMYNHIFDAVREEWGGPYALDYFAPEADSEFRQWWAKFLRQAASPSVALQSVEMMRDIDMTAILPDVKAPTLVIHARHNMVVRVEAGRYIADNIPNARYVEIPTRSHLWWWDADVYVNEIESFLENIYDSL